MAWYTGVQSAEDGLGAVPEDVANYFSPVNNGLHSQRKKKPQKIEEGEHQFENVNTDFVAEGS